MFDAEMTSLGIEAIDHLAARSRLGDDGPERAIEGGGVERAVEIALEELDGSADGAASPWSCGRPCAGSASRVRRHNQRNREGRGVNPH
jgi:hypothetical protein